MGRSTTFITKLYLYSVSDKASEDSSTSNDDASLENTGGLRDLLDDNIKKIREEIDGQGRSQTVQSLADPLFVNG